MFVCRVLVGCYTRGQSQYRLPPSRDGGLILYDSCVNDGRDPSIFVVFDKQQVYPEFLITYTEHVYRPCLSSIDSSSDSDDFTSFKPVTSTQLHSTQNLAVLTTIANAPQTVTVSSLTSTSSVSPSPVVPSASGGFHSTRLTLGQNAVQSSASTSSKQPSDPLQTVQTSKRVSNSDYGGWEYIDPKSAFSQSRYSSLDASLTSSSVRSATNTSASTRRASPPLLTTTTRSYTRQVTHPQSQEDLYYVPRSTVRRTNQPKKKEECILL